MGLVIKAIELGNQKAELLRAKGNRYYVRHVVNGQTFATPYFLDYSVADGHFDQYAHIVKNTALVS